MKVVAYADVETLTKLWLLTTSVAPLVTRPDGGVSIYLAMPAASPVPSVILSRVGGGPRARKDIPEDVARISFDCWGNTRVQSMAVAEAVLGECESLARTGSYTVGDSHLLAAEVTGWVWVPDPNSDIPRYVVDALFTAVRG